ncbi:MAG: hypothetical protein Q9P14_00715 [candidate division KSB1 bacterium]|nr:hypothetical protein [candidate division KSB1 bacterium]
MPLRMRERLRRMNTTVSPTRIWRSFFKIRQAAERLDTCVTCSRASALLLRVAMMLSPMASPTFLPTSMYTPSIEMYLMLPLPVA